MKTVIAGLVAALALTGGAAGPAEAAPIRECGHWNLNYGVKVSTPPRATSVASWRASKSGVHGRS